MRYFGRSIIQVQHSRPLGAANEWGNVLLMERVYAERRPVERIGQRASVNCSQQSRVKQVVPWHKPVWYWLFSSVQCSSQMFHHCSPTQCSNLSHEPTIWLRHPSEISLLSFLINGALRVNRSRLWSSLDPISHMGQWNRCSLGSPHLL